MSRLSPSSVWGLTARGRARARLLDALSSVFRGSDRQFVVVVILAALSIRVVWVLFVQPHPLSDFNWYFHRGIDISEGRGYVQDDGALTAFWPIGYPAFLGGVFKLFGPSVLAGALANAVLSSGTVALFYLLAASLTSSIVVARLATIFFLAWPNQIAYVSLLSDSILFQFFVCAILLMLLRPKSIPTLVLAGVLTGCAALVRPYGILLPVVIGAVRFSRWPMGHLLKTLCIVFAVAALTIAPWIVRNHQVFGAWFFISNNGGVTLLKGNSPVATGAYRQDGQTELLGYRNISNEYERDQFAKSMAVDYIVHNPLKTVALVPVKLAFEFAEDADGLRWNIKGVRGDPEELHARPDQSYGTGVGDYYPSEYLAMAGFELYYLAGLGGLVGYLWLTFRKREVAAVDVLGLAILGYMAAIGAIFIGEPRFHFPAIPFVTPYAAAFVTSPTFLGWLARVWKPLGRARNFGLGTPGLSSGSR